MALSALNQEGLLFSHVTPHVLASNSIYKVDFNVNTTKFFFMQ